MSARLKNPPEFCLFHQNADCSCINPIDNKADLIKKLRQEINLNNYLNQNEPDSRKKYERNQETLKLEIRLKDLL